MLIINDENFETEVLKSEIPVMVDFFADWCVPCKMLAPMLEELSGEISPKAKIVKLDVDQSPETAKAYGIMSVPTLIVFKDGAMISKTVGGKSKEELLSLLEV